MAFWKFGQEMNPQFMFLGRRVKKEGREKVKLWLGEKGVKLSSTHTLSPLPYGQSSLWSFCLLFWRGRKTDVTFSSPLLWVSPHFRALEMGEACMQMREREREQNCTGRPSGEKSNKTCIVCFFLSGCVRARNSQEQNMRDPSSLTQKKTWQLIFDISFLGEARKAGTCHSILACQVSWCLWYDKLMFCGLQRLTNLF